MTAAGFFGKLPARGDFVRVGLPRGFTDPWDAWLRRVIPASRDILGEAWTAAWLEAPVWRFALPPGLCGPDAAMGLWMPSVDRAGRYFPLTLARIGAHIGGSGMVDPHFLSVAEAAGCAAIAEDWAPEALAAHLAAGQEADGTTPAGDEADGTAPAGDEAGATAPAGAMWWTAGCPRRTAWTFTRPDLPDGLTFAWMLDARAGGDVS